MKISRLFIAVAALTVAMVSCQKEAEPVKNNTKTVRFIARSITDTKTAFGEKVGTSYPTLWTANDSKVSISLNFAAAKEAAVIPASDYKSASFDVEIKAGETGPFTFYSLSPSKACLSVSGLYESFTIEIPTSQIPTSTSVDEAAQIIAAKSADFEALQDQVSFDFSHVTAYGRMSLTNLSLGGATISSVALTADENWAGRWYYYFADGRVEANSASATITLNTTSDENIWFACAPVDLGGKKLTITVNTTAGPFVKEITWPAGKAFTSGKVYKFAVDMTGITPSGTKTYTKVTSKDDITVDSELIIVADTANCAMSTTQNPNNRARAGITKTGNTIDNPGSDVQVFKAKVGNKEQTIAFSTGSGYIYAASSSGNHLKTQTSLDDNASFSLEISGGKATLVAQGSNTKNTLQYNYNGGSSIFACYGGATQGAVCIYKLNGSGTDTPIFASIPVTGVTLDETATVAVGGTKTLTYSVLPSNAGNQNVSWSSDNPAVATVDANGKVTGVAAGTATITVTTEDGNFTAECSITVSAAASTTYTKITSLSQLTSGDYVIVGAQKASGLGVLEYGTLNSGRIPYSQNYTSVPASIDNPVEGAVWHLTVSDQAVTLYNVANEKYIADAGNGKLKYADTGMSFTAACTDEVFSLASGSSYFLCVNSSSDYWRNYAASTGYKSGVCLYLYKKN